MPNFINFLALATEQQQKKQIMMIVNCYDDKMLEKQWSWPTQPEQPCRYLNTKKDP